MAASPVTLSVSWLRDPALQRIMALVAQSGFEARAVGGCVRDAIIGSDGPTDVDLATTMAAESVMKVLAENGFKVIPTGLDHGTVTAIFKGAEAQKFEITTLRRDIATDGRHAVTVSTDDWCEDARRRDFTMNALYADAKGRVYDPLAAMGQSGLDDLAARRVRFIDDPRARITEDYLRILRYFRFHFRFAATLEPDRDAFAACQEMAAGIDHLSRERITEELIKIARLDAFPACLQSMCEAGLWPHIFAFPLPRDEVWQALKQVIVLSDDPMQRLGILCSRPEDIQATKLRLSRADIKRLEAMLDPKIAAALPEDDGPLQAFYAVAYWHGVVATCDHIVLRAARHAQALPKGTLAALWQWQRPSCPVDGQDLMSHGINAGPDLGRVLHQLQSEWVESGFSLTRDALLARLK